MLEIVDQLRRYGDAVERAAIEAGAATAGRSGWQEGRLPAVDSADRAGSGSRSQQQSRRTLVIAIAAVLIAAAGVGLAVWLGDSPRQIEAAVGEPGLDERIESLARSGQLATLALSDDAARELHSEAQVLAAETVGAVEIGPPPERLVQAAAWLVDGHCVAATAVLGCVAVVDQESGRRQTLVVSNDGGFHMISDQGSDQPILVYGSSPNPTLLATLLPAGAALVEVSFGSETIGQIPIEQTVAFAIPSEARSITVHIFADNGDLILQTMFELPDGLLDGLIGDQPAGEGDPSAEELPPSTMLGSDAIWPEPLETAGPQALGQRFASEVLGWGNPQVTIDPEAAPNGPTWVTIANNAGPDIRMVVVPFGDSGWGTAQIGEPTVIGTTGRPGESLIGIRQIPGATEVVIHIADVTGRTRAWHAGLTNYVEPTSVIVPHIENEQIASILVLYNDSMGRTLSAHGGQYVD